MECTDGLVTDYVVYNSTESPEFEFSDYTQRVIVAIFYLIASVLGIFGNSLVILAVILSKKLRTATNAFVVNLSIADLVTSLAIPWNAVALLGTDGLPVAEWVCSAVSAVQTITTGCSLYTLASIGLNRLLLITRPASTYRFIYSPRKIAAWLVLTWLAPLLITILPPLLDVGALGYNPKYHHCGFVSSHNRSTDYNVIIASAFYPIPFFLLIVCYAIIWRHLNRHAKKFLGSPSTSSELSSNNNTTPLESVTVTSTDYQHGPSSRSPARTGTAVNPSLLSSRQREITKNMFYVVCAYFLCFTPFAICLFYVDSDPALPYASVTLVFNSCVNPLIYATKHRDFKAVFGRILRRQWDHIPEPSDSLKYLRRTKCCGKRDEYA